jgi:integrase/recombinase XerD
MNKNPEYNFNPEIKDKLKGFKTYLQELGNGENTIRQKMNYTGYFMKWLESENLQPEETTYSDLLNFIDYCRLEEKSTRQINSTLRSIKNYFEYLKTSNPEIVNPASNLQLKGKVNKLPSNIISYAKLEQLYQSFKANDNRSNRNKIILGFLIYQGVTTEELKQLETNHLKLKQGKIYVPGNRRRNSRTLELKPCQILELNEYLAQTRPKILKEISKPKPARKLDTINKARLKEQLFISINGSENIKNSLHHLFLNIHKTNPEILSPKQIRASVITYWLKNYNLRQVQYMAGHKHVSSTERYQLNNLDKLQEKIEKLHPLNHNQNEY